MQNIKTLAILVFLLAVEASARTQVLIWGNEKSPITLNAGAKADMGGYSISRDDHGMGLKSMGADIGIAHYVGHDFEYGFNTFGAWATSTGGKLFSEQGKYDGFKTETTLNGRYMPHLSENVRLGGFLSLGYSYLFGEGHKSLHEAFAFGDLSFDIGPSFMHQSSSLFSWGFGMTYGMGEVRFGGKGAHEKLKQYSNFHTVRVPFEFLWQAGDNIRIALAVEPGWRHLGGNHKFYHGLFYDVFAGVVVGL